MACFNPVSVRYSFWFLSNFTKVSNLADIDTLDDIDYIEWLERHGIDKDFTMQTPVCIHFYTANLALLN